MIATIASLTKSLEKTKDKKKYLKKLAYILTDKITAMPPSCNESHIVNQQRVKELEVDNKDHKSQMTNLKRPSRSLSLILKV